MDVDSASAAARRRRERRLRQFLRHERLSVAVALADSQHRTSRGQKMARAGEWRHEEDKRVTMTEAPSSPGVLPVVRRGGRRRGEVRPGSVTDPRPQERVLRHTVEHIVDFVHSAPTVEILDALEKKHRTSRGQRKDRTGEWVRDALHGQAPGAPTPQLDFFQLFEEAVWVSRGGPQEKVQQRTVEQLPVVVPMVQILDIPGPQGGKPAGGGVPGP